MIFQVAAVLRARAEMQDSRHFTVARMQSECPFSTRPEISGGLLFQRIFMKMLSCFRF